MRFYYTISQVHVSFLQEGVKAHGNYMPFGGGSEWTLQYGCIGFSRKKQVMGYDYELCRGKTYSKSANGTIIPAAVKTKKEVLSIAKAIGILKTLV